VKKGKFTTEICKFFETVQQRILKNKAKNNSILLVTGADNDWATSNKESDKYMKRAIDNCNGLYYGFDLKFDHKQDDEDDRSKNLKKRQTSIDEFINYLNSKSFEKVNLNHVQTAEFEKEWYEYIIPILLEILKTMVSSFEKIRELRTLANDSCKIN
jgi:hypothetical protein